MPVLFFPSNKTFDIYHYFRCVIIIIINIDETYSTSSNSAIMWYSNSANICVVKIINKVFSSKSEASQYILKYIFLPQYLSVSVCHTVRWR